MRLRHHSFNAPATRPKSAKRERRESNRKAYGTRPGKQGAEKIAAELWFALSRAVEVAFRPDGVKDAREGVRSRRGQVKEGRIMDTNTNGLIPAALPALDAGTTDLSLAAE
jgi:hypothetical protein